MLNPRQFDIVLTSMSPISVILQMNCKLVQNIVPAGTNCPYEWGKWQIRDRDRHTHRKMDKYHLEYKKPEKKQTN